MRGMLLDFSPQGWGRVWLGAVIGTLGCVAIAFAIDGYSPASGTWSWGSRPINNLVIPVVLGIPLFSYLLAKQRQLAVAHEELMILSSTDALTSCLNRRAFVALVERYLDRMERHHTLEQAALLVIDVDHFKMINDSFGHDIGDVALIKVAHAIKDSVRQSDAVGRIGGEEFSVLLSGASHDGATAVAEHIRKNVYDTDLGLPGASRQLSVSVGGVTFDKTSDLRTLFRTADQRLYAAKRAGRNLVVMHDLEPRPSEGFVAEDGSGQQLRRSRS